MILCFINNLKEKDTEIVNTYFNIININNSSIIQEAEKDNQKIYNILNNNELEIYYAKCFYKRKRTFLGGRLAGKEAASNFLINKNLKQIEIVPGGFGQPILKCNEKEIPNISISHNNNYAIAIAFPKEHNIAIDIEEDIVEGSIINKDRFIFLESIIKEEEINLIKNLNIDYNASLLILWTMKETLAKAIQCGIAVDFEVLKINNINKIKENIIEGEFKYFSGIYKVISIIIDKIYISIIFPNYLTPLLENFTNNLDKILR